MSIDRWTFMKKNEIMPFAAWKGLVIIILSEVSQKEKDKYCMWNLKYDKNEHFCETETDSQT